MRTQSQAGSKGEAMMGKRRTRRFRATAALVGLAIAGLAGLCAGCDPLNSHLSAFGAGYLLGRWEATRVEVVRTVRVCYQNDVQVPCQ